jgi:hypothetical protein
MLLKGISCIEPKPKDEGHSCKSTTWWRLRHRSVCRECTRAELEPFLQRLNGSLQREVQNLKDKTFPADFILLSMAKFGDLFYAVSKQHIRLVALGWWKKIMAPPSPVEAFVMLALRHAIALRCRYFAANTHVGTKGCLFDFTDDLAEARFKVLLGFICDECRRVLVSSGEGQLG